MSVLKIGLIGCGSIGKVHARSISMINGADLVALVDINKQRALTLARRYGVKKVYEGHIEMLESEKPDGVIIATPNYLHSQITVDSLSRGVNVLCEKPMATNSTEARTMVKAKSDSGRILMLGMCQRFSDEAKVVKRLYERGLLGTVYFTSASLLRRKGIPGMGSWFTRRSLSGGGILADCGPHIIDIALWMQGYPRPVTARGRTFAKIGPQGKGLGTWGMPELGGGFDVEDLALGLINLENGGSFHLEVSWALNTSEDTFNCILSGDKAGASLHPPLMFRESHGRWIQTAFKCRPVDVYVEEMKHFVDCIRKGTEPEPSPEQGVVVMKVIDAIYNSALAGREVTIE